MLYRLNSVIDEDSNMLLDRFIILKQLGSGGYGEVFSAIDSTDFKHVAIKVSYGDGLTKERNLAEAKYLDMLKSSNSPYAHLVVQMKTWFEVEHCVVIVLELLSHNLAKSISDNLVDNIETISKYAKQMIDFLMFMSEMDIIHGDIKPENILIEKVGESIKFADFGLAQDSYEQSKLWAVQTLYYMAPEVVLGYDYDSSIDTWSTGCVIVECFLKKRFFQATNQLELLQTIALIIGTPRQEVIEQSPKRDQYFTFDFQSRLWIVKGFTCPITPIGVKQYLKTYHNINESSFEFILLIDMVEKMLKIEISDRLSPQECLKHPFITRFQNALISGKCQNSEESDSKKIFKNTKLFREKNHNIIENDEIILREMNQICRKMNIDKIVMENAKRFFRTIRDKNIIKRQNMMAVMICCLYLECQKSYLWTSYKSLSSASGINLREIIKVHRIVKNFTESQMKMKLDKDCKAENKLKENRQKKFEIYRDICA